MTKTSEEGREIRFLHGAINRNCTNCRMGRRGFPSPLAQQLVSECVRDECEFHRYRKIYPKPYDRAF